MLREQLEKNRETFDYYSHSLNEVSQLKEKIEILQLSLEDKNCRILSLESALTIAGILFE